MSRSQLMLWPAAAIDKYAIVYRHGKLKAIEDAVYWGERRGQTQRELDFLETENADSPEKPV